MPVDLSTALQAAALVELTRRERANDKAPAFNPWQTLGPWRTIGEARTITYEYQEQRYRVAVSAAPGESWQVRINEQPAQSIAWTPAQEHLVLLRYGSKLVRATVLRQNEQTLVSVRGQVFALARRQPPDVDQTAQSSAGVAVQKALTAPMAGTIVKVQVSDGQEVEQRQVLIILTAMKMEHTITAPHAGKIRRVHYKEGEVVRGGAVLVEME